MNGFSRAHMLPAFWSEFSNWWTKQSAWKIGFIFGLQLFIISLVWSRAGISIGTVIMMVSALGSVKLGAIRSRLTQDPLILGWPLLWIGYVVVEWISSGFQFPSLSFGNSFLFILPLTLLMGPRLSQGEIRVAKDVLSISLIAALLMGLVSGGIEAVSHHQSIAQHITYVSLGKSLGQHPTYLSILIGIALFWHLADLTVRPRRTYAWAMVGGLLLFLVLLNARMQLLLIGGILGISMMIWLWHHNRHLIPSGMLSAGLLLVATYAVLPSNAQQRIVDMWQVEEEQPVDQIRHNSKAVRLYIWGAATELIAMEPLWGYGIGEVQAALNQTYQADEVPVANFNAHQQLLHTWLELGMLGSIALAAIAILYVGRAIRQKNWVLGMIVLLCVLSGFSEVILGRQLGISIVAFFWPLFALHLPDK